MKLRLPSTLLALVLFSGCGRSMPNVQPVRPAALRSDTPLSLPLVLELQPGDRIPVDLRVDGDLMQIDPGAEAPTVVVKRRFFVLIQQDEPPRISLDGKTLGDVHGAIGVGLGVHPDRGVRATVGLSTSTPAH